MAQLGHFDPSQVNDDRQLLPEGEYALQVIESDVVPTKSGNGTLLNLTYEVVEGPASRRRIWDRINIANANVEAQEIGQRQLKRLCDAIGVGAISDSEQLHFKPFRGRVAVEAGQGGFDDKNIVKGFKPYGANRGPIASSPPPQEQQPAQPPAAYTPPAQQQAAAGGSARPWR